MTGPLLVTVPYEKGTIVFTSTHNEKVNSEPETKLLRFVVHLAITAKEAASAQPLMLAGGFSPRKEILLSVEAGSATGAYENDKRRPLRFVLTFPSLGVDLRLVVRGPAGQSYAQQGTTTFAIDVLDATAGGWTATVTPNAVPYPKSPFIRLTVLGH